MVEYALLLAGTSIGSFAASAARWLTGLDATGLWYGLLALVVLRIAFWAFRS